MERSRRRILVAAVAAPVVTAAIMGALIIRKVVTTPQEEKPVVAVPSDPREEALLKLSAADTMTPEDLVRAADEAERAAGTPLVEACLARARAARRLRNPDAERAAVDKALSIDPSRPEAQLARALVAAESWAGASAPHARVHAPEIDFSSPLLVPPSPEIETAGPFTGRAGDVMSLLAVLKTGGKPEEIAPIWTRLSAHGVEDRLAFAMGVHSLRLGAPDDAILWLRTAAAADPENPARLRAAALASLLAGESREALDFIRRWSAGGGKPDPAEALGWWAVAARKVDDMKEARLKLDEASKIDPAWRGARGWLAYHMGDKAQARDDATARFESDPWARYLRALIHWDAGEVDAALADCTALLEAVPDHYEGLVLQARGLTARGRNDKAEEMWKHAQRIAAGRTEAKLGLAEFYAATGRRDEAITHFIEVPGLAISHWRGAQLMLDLGRHGEALRWAEMGVSRFPTDARIRMVLARVLHARMDHFGERAQLERAAQIAPDDAEVKKLLAECVAEFKRE